MTRARRLAAGLLLLGSAAALPGCYFARSCIPMDPSGMEFPVDWVSATFEDQVKRTGETLSSLPGGIRSHCRESWRNLTVYPGE
ncbi:MAG: hypothetical protein HUU06_02025 [Planctomycetaceae bacterium]|nr:hypothetical protein [Planctomycetota bacterium]NUN51551.1 hypothetical protein [Planctomycetaceae bacterium]